MGYLSDDGTTPDPCGRFWLTRNTQTHPHSSKTHSNTQNTQMVTHRNKQTHTNKHTHAHTHTYEYTVLRRHDLA